MTAPAFQPSEVFFLVTLSILAILWVPVLVWFTAALLEHPRDTHAKPVGVGEVRSALLALNRADHPYRLVALSDAELKLDWNVVDSSWYELFGRVKLSTIYRARLLLRERDHEVRCHETLRSGEFFIGFRGLVPTFNWHFRYQSGMLNVMWSGVAYGIKKVFPPQIGQVYHFTLDTVRAKREIEEVARSKGWYFRGVPLGFEATVAGAALADRLAVRLVPSFLQGWSRKRFWGAIYLMICGAIVALFVVWMDWTVKNLLVVGLMIAFLAAVQTLVVGMWRGLEWFSRRRAIHRSRIR